MNANSPFNVLQDRGEFSSKYWSQERGEGIVSNESCYIYANKNIYEIFFSFVSTLMEDEDEILNNLWKKGDGERQTACEPGCPFFNEDEDEEACDE